VREGEAPGFLISLYKMLFYWREAQMSVFPFFVQYYCLTIYERIYKGLIPE